MLVAAAYAHFVPFLLVAARLGGLVTFAPVLDHSAIPARVKLSLVLVLAGVFCLAFGVGKGLNVGLDDPWPILGLLIKEFVTGLILSLSMQCIFSALSFAGSILAPQMGLAVSQLFDPSSQSMQPLLATFLGLVGMLFFLAIDGHLLMIRAFYESYALLPMGGLSVQGPMMQQLVRTAGELFVVGFKLSAPVLAVIVFLNIGMAVMARAVPQVNVIAVGFIITITVGFLSLYFVLPQLGPMLRETFLHMIENALWIIKAA